MTLLGTLLRDSRPPESSHAWHQPQLAAPETIEVTSTEFAHGGSLQPRHTGRRVGGDNLSPQLSWSEPPAGTDALLLLVEDLDIPIGPKPAVHCLALVDPAQTREVVSGGLGRRTPGDGVALLRATFGTGYLGAEPLKGHGPHRYVFQVFALGAKPARLDAGPRAVLALLNVPVLARGRITGIYER